MEFRSRAPPPASARSVQIIALACCCEIGCNANESLNHIRAHIESAFRIVCYLYFKIENNTEEVYISLAIALPNDAGLNFDGTVLRPCCRWKALLGGQRGTY